MQRTAANSGLKLVLALSYSGRWELTRAVQQLASQVQAGRLQPGDISESHLENALATAGLPAVDLMIRTGGDHRISNFLLWQLAYAELYFTNVFWPDFRKKHLHQALAEYQKRERRFGKTSEQVQ